VTPGERSSPIAANPRRKRCRIQEAFLAAFLGLKALRDADRFRAWILGIVANVCEFRCHSAKLREAGVWPVMTADAASESGALPFDGFF
jgi:DNA-directed RNA polymerase specialized sigma24 family protein